MATKLLYSLADDNQDLQKQIGCTTGCFNSLIVPMPSLVGALATRGFLKVIMVSTV